MLMMLFCNMAVCNYIFLFYLQISKAALIIVADGTVAMFKH